MSIKSKSAASDFIAATFAAVDLRQLVEVAELVELQQATVARWHREPLDNRYGGFHGLVCQQHQYNYALWHEEDMARSPEAGDMRIAAVKRAIDRYNQQRNDAIEKLDDFLVAAVATLGIVAQPEAKLNTETPGSTIDRLSILALRIYHMQEQVERADATSEHVAKAEHRLAILREQHRDLSSALADLLADIFAGRKRLKVYRQFKMYNDPSLNPYLYAKQAA
ncbi:MAG TPA: DUF4254 domain-containing protein [Pirellulales bacterium]|jgi:hypothetical protein|nr:DUF4254 domain-containing protein [Pirellulales bacterium]